MSDVPVTAAGSEIAVVGMAGRWPGAATIDEFWRNLSQGIESVRRFSETELLAAGEALDVIRDPGYVPARPIVEDVDLFDASFFGFSPQDAAIMDPQHRLFLEAGWAALEHAGHDAARFAGQVGVFATCGMNTYMMYHLVTNARIMETVGEWLVRHTGNDMNFLATRLSYQLNLKGPSLNVQSACSSALVAIHLAAQSLLNGECDMAMAGGSVVALPQDRGYLYKQGEILAPDGHCRAFDAKAAGTLFGSGVGIVVLRRLADALADGDDIYAIIKGSAVNNDGAMKVGYLAPSVEGQSRAITEALAIGGVDAETISYVETHGTGTLVGDPIEITALTEAFRQYTQKTQFCPIGSLKPNIGHLGEAAGVASFIKTVLSLRHRQIPPSINFDTPNPRIDFANSPFFVNDRLRDWISPGGPRRAGVTSLGAGGTNCHIIVEEAPARAAGDPARAEQLLVLSARTPTALESMRRALADALERPDAPDLADAAYTLQVGRTVFAHRWTAVARGRDEAVRLLRSGGVTSHDQSAGSNAPVVFLFPGMGAQHPNMGRGLYDNEPLFRAEIDRGFAIVRRRFGIDLAPMWFTSADGASAAGKQLAQPMPMMFSIFIIEHALARLWLSWGVTPAAMSGHSLGEYAAACLAGVFTFEDALAIIHARGVAFSRLPPGAMLSVLLPERDLQSRVSGNVALAAVNAPETCVVSGPVDEIAALEQRLTADGVETQRLHVDVAAHSPMLDPFLDEFRRAVAAVTLSAPSLPLLSNLTGRWMTPEDATDPEYWVKHLRHTVRFHDGLTTLLANPKQVLLEVGPGRTLTSLSRRQAAKPLALVTSLRHPSEDLGDVTTMVSAVGRLWAVGVTPDWAAFHSGRRRRVALPTYPFERQRHWIPAGNPLAPAAAASVTTTTRPVGSTARDPDVANWFYTPSWQTSHDVPAAAFTGDVLVFNDERGVAAAAVSLAMDASSPDADARLDFPTPGDPDVARLVPCDVPAPGANEVRIRVSAAALNFADVLKVSGLQPDAPFGMECAGVVEAVGSAVTSVAPGDEVVAIGPNSFQTRVIRDARFVARKPATLSAIEAATIPAAFMTALYALEHVGRLQTGDRVLIHAASGGVGLAAIQVAKARGAEIFATAGSDEKRAFLTSIGIRHVFPSRSLDFADAVMAASGGRGVDVILNSLTGEFIPASLRLLAAGGRFVEIGKKDIYTASQLAELSLRDGVTYHAVDLTKTLRDEPDVYGRLLAESVARVDDGTWRPLPHHDFPVAEAVAAFRLMGAARHIGKVVLDFTARRGRTWLVSRGARFEAVGPDRFTIDPHRPADYAALFDALGPSVTSLAHVVDAWPLDARDEDGLDAVLDAHFYLPLALAQAIGRQELTQPMTLTFVTSGTADVAGETPIAPARATLLGPCLVIPRELATVATRIVDVILPVSEWQRDRASRQVAAELAKPVTDARVAYRGHTRWVPRFDRRRLDRPPTPAIRPRGVYLITGGTGGLGLALAGHLATSAQARLVLVGRTPLPPRRDWDRYLAEHGSDDGLARRLRGVLACEAAGADVMAETADVADADQMRRVIARVTDAFGAIDGVFHTAGTLDDGPLQVKAHEAAAAVLRPKVHGTLVLDDALRDRHVGFVALFSSVSSVLGLQGQVDYTAANAFLDAFAQKKASEGGAPFLSIGWGPWQDVGLAATAALGRTPASDARPTHPWLEHVRRGTAGDATFTTTLARDRQWMIGEHVTRDGDAVLPGTGYLELMQAALAERPQSRAIDIRNVFFEAPLIVKAGETKAIAIGLTPDAPGFDVRVSSSDGTHASGHVRYVDDARPPRIDVAAIDARCSTPLATPGRRLDQPFMTFGPRWANIDHVGLGVKDAMIRLRLPDAFAADVPSFRLHPALLDMATGAAQHLIPAFDQATDFYVPFSYSRLRLFDTLPATLVSHVRLAEGTGNGLAVFDVTIADTRGEVVADISGFCMKRVDAAGLAGSAARHHATATMTPQSSAGSLANDMLQNGIRVTEGLDALERVIASGAGAHVLVSTGDLDAWRARVDAQARAEAARTTTPAAEAHLRPAAAATQAGRTASSGPGNGNDVEARLAQMWSDLLGVETVDRSASFFEMGGHSLLAVRLLTRIEKTFHKTIPLQALFQANTVDSLAALVRGDDAATPERLVSPILVPLTEADGPAFYCVHSLGGEVVSFLSLARALGPAQRFVGLQVPLNEDVETLAASIESLAARYVRELIAAQPEGPYYVGGWSAGSTIALEMAQQLKATGRHVALLVLLDGAPFNSGAETRPWDPRYAAKLLQNVPHWITDDLLTNFSAAEFARRVRSKAVAIAHTSTAPFRRNQATRDAQLEGFIDLTHWSPQERAFMQRLFAILPKYRPKPYDGRVLVYQARTEPLYHLFEIDKIWRRLAADVEVVRVTGTHISLIQPPHVNALAADLRARLTRARQPR